MNRKSKIVLAAFLFLCLASGLSMMTLAREKLINFLVASGLVTVRQEASYIGLTYEQLVDSADIIGVGKLTTISVTRWNQDNGAYWFNESADKNTPSAMGLQLHTVEFEVSQFIVDRTSYGQKTIEITVLGPSPLEGKAEYNLKQGDEVVFFIKKTELAWRDGTRPIFGLLTAPSNSYLIRGEDGLFRGLRVQENPGVFVEKRPISLTELVQEITQRRETIVQP